MMLEFPDDPACDYLRPPGTCWGWSVAPVFSESGDVRFCRKDAGRTWRHNDEIQGRLARQQHGFPSLPVYVRDNTLLALGNNEQQLKPDYAWDEGTAFQLLTAKTGMNGMVEVPAADGSGGVYAESVTSRGNIVTLTGVGERRKTDGVLAQLAKVGGREGRFTCRERGVAGESRGMSWWIRCNLSWKNAEVR